jgi:hypothetical protein
MRLLLARRSGMVTSGSFIRPLEPVRQTMSRVLRTGLTGLPLTSAAHRLLPNKNDPEGPCRRRYIRLLPLKAAAHTEPRRWLLTLTLAADPAAGCSLCRR